MPAKWGCLCIGAALAAWTALSLAAQEEKLPPPRSLPEALPPKFHFQGASSCSAAGCHNNNAPRGMRGGEYSTWVAHDKHARAYLVLLGDRSKQIEMRFRQLDSPSKAHPEKDTLCLKCHVDQRAEWVAADFRLDGVSCESCHGSAERWLPLHFRDPWRALGSEEKAALGMHDTRSLLGRAKLCADCHVGTPGADVNHDLIAAGHPPLKFEFAAYHANMPHHWRDARDKRPDLGGRPDFEALAWKVGQVVSAQKALELLEHRASTKDDKQPWPEFADYDCFACHHDLKAKNARQGKGTLPMADWYYALLPQATGAKVDLTKLREALEKRRPSKAQVAELAKAVHGSLALPAAPAEDDDAMLDRFLKISRHFQNQDVSYDKAVQVYLALAALHNGMSDVLGRKQVVSDEWLNALTGLRKDLRYPGGLSSPRDYDPTILKKRLMDIDVSPRR